MKKDFFTILIDYDNLSLLDKQRGLIAVVEKILSLVKNEIVGKTNVDVRLYGGWYTQNKITQRAQNLVTEIVTSFPAAITPPITANNLIVNASLAYSLLITPNEHLLETFRIRGFPSDLHCDDPRNHGCTSLTCPINHIYDFINFQKCKGQCCGIVPSDILYRGEQKLVDSMLTNDLIYLSMSNSKPIVIVSSDDDFWPSIRTALALSTDVIHLLTKNYTTPQHYLQYANKYYIQYKL